MIDEREEELLTLRIEVEQLRQERRELTATQVELLRTLNAIDESVIAVNPEGFVLRLNSAAERLTGFKKEEAVGIPADQLLAVQPGTQPLDALRRCLASSEVVSVEGKPSALLRAGNSRVLSETASPLRGENNTPLGAVVIIRDVTEQQLMEGHLRHAQKMDSIGQLAGGVAHDFNNMLGAILGTAELLSLGIGDKDRHSELIIRTARSAADLTGKLLTFSRKGVGKHGPFAIGPAIEDALSMLTHTIDKRVSIRMEASDQTAHVVGDRSAIQNAVLNLGVNAAHAMPQGGTLSVTLTRVTLTEGNCNESAFPISPGEFCKITVEDQGMGMSPEVLEHVFEPFFTTKALGEGTGLGLSAVYGTMHDHRGSLSIDSKEGTGTKVSLYLPLTSRHPLYELGENVPRGSGLILVIDDEESIRHTAKAMLESLGYEAVVAEDGASGLAVLSRQAGQFRLALLDVVMPSMAGLDCLSHIRKHHGALPVLMTSGFTRDTALADLQNQGISGFLKKPFRRADLARAVADALATEDDPPCPTSSS